jgi:zinc protease
MRAFLILVLLLGLPVWAEGPARDTPPEADPLRPLVLPEVKKGQLANGLVVWVVERHEVPVVQVTLALPAGGERDPGGQFGLASFTSALLTEGAGGKTALQLADESDFLGADLSASSGLDGASVDLYVPVARLRPALELMSLVATWREFPAEAIERHREEVLTEFLQAREDPGGLMALAFPSALYPKEHRYGSLGLGTESTIKALDREQLVAFHAAHYRPDQSLMIVVGDVKAADVVDELNTVFGGWKATSEGAARGTTLPPVAQVKGRRLVVVDRPGAAQTVIRIARLGVARKTPDYYPLTVLNTILGGSFTSRLNQNLREEHGYTYGARSVFEMRRQPGPFYAAANVQTDKTGPALREFFKELQAIRQPLTPAELAKAKNYLAYGYPADFQTVGQVAAKLEGLWTYGLSESSLSEFVPRIQQVTSADVRRVAETYVVPEDMVIVMVGDWKEIEPQLAGMELGKVEMVSP